MEKSVLYYLTVHAGLVTLYNDLRRTKEHDGYGDYIVLATICKVAKTKGIVFSKVEIQQALKECNDREFTKIPINHTLVTQLSEL